MKWFTVTYGHGRDRNGPFWALELHSLGAGVRVYLTHGTRGWFFVGGGTDSEEATGVPPLHLPRTGRPAGRPTVFFEKRWQAMEWLRAHDARLRLVGLEPET